jgi:aspartyl-tRNA synthetase
MFDTTPTRHRYVALHHPFTAPRSTMSLIWANAVTSVVAAGYDAALTQRQRNRRRLDHPSPGHAGAV